MNNKEAIKEIENLINNGIVLKTTTVNIPRKIVEALETAIKALQERPKGQWENEDIDYYRCTNCGIYEVDRGNFCPNCGADMRGEQE